MERASMSNEELLAAIMAELSSHKAEIIQRCADLEASVKGAERRLNGRLDDVENDIRKLTSRFNAFVAAE